MLCVSKREGEAEESSVLCVYCKCLCNMGKCVVCECVLGKCAVCECVGACVMWLSVLCVGVVCGCLLGKCAVCECVLCVSV